MSEYTKSLLQRNFLFLFALLLIFLSGEVFISCKSKKKPEEKVIVKEPQQMNEMVKGLIKNYLDYAESTNGNLNDSTKLYQVPALVNLYAQKGNTPLWSSAQTWQAKGDSLFFFIKNVRRYGLFPSDYHFYRLESIRHLFNVDTWKEKETRNASEWALADLLMSDAIISVFYDIKMGRLPADSITLRKDSTMNPDLVTAKFYDVISGTAPDTVVASLEPVHTGYRDLKKAIGNFLANADFSPIDTITFPNKDRNQLNSEVKRRLFEIGYLDTITVNADSVQLSKVLKKFQEEKKLTVDGKVGRQTIGMLNLSDEEKFKRIAITMDRYKMLPEKMPEKYIWVNIPSYSLRLVNDDTVLISSKVVVGKPMTRTPVLTSAISDMITYPQWTIPASIIEKEILPGLKRDTAYLRKKGYSLLDKKNEEVNPDSIDWSQYKKLIPYKVIQGSGDDNALGVLKFNFPNKYSVYLHDTNQRSFFAQDIRALSHGCVRVQEWQKMATFIMNNENDSAVVKKNPKQIPLDSLNRWLAVKEKHSIPLKSRIPVYIRYFTCEAVNGKIAFYEDIYEEDKQLSNLLFANKKM